MVVNPHDRNNVIEKPVTCQSKRRPGAAGGGVCFCDPGNPNADLATYIAMGKAAARAVVGQFPLRRAARKSPHPAARGLMWPYVTGPLGRRLRIRPTTLSQKHCRKKHLHLVGDFVILAPVFVSARRHR